jgi:3-hydroxyisobutyrate dehydrogenase-like beta-hydroxyacid dehydrogenase
VEAVYLAKDGIIAGADSQTVACEMSTIDPGTTRRIGDRSGELTLLDTPVSGGPEDAARGTLLVIVGGDRETFEAPSVQSVLGSLGRNLFHAGDLGAGHTVKLLNNVMSAGNLLLAMEAISFGVHCGIDGRVLYEILTSTGGSSNQLEKRLPRVLNRNFEPGFSTEYARKDVGLAVAYADEEDVPLHLASAIHRFLVEASNAGYGDDDMCGVVKLFERFGDEIVKSNRPMDESYEGY